VTRSRARSTARARAWLARSVPAPPWALISIPLLVGAVDSIRTEPGRGDLGTALLDEPAHLATALLLLLACRRRISLVLVVGAALGACAIDLDHLPAMLGQVGLTEGTVRPYTHALPTLVALLAGAVATRGATRTGLLGAALGFGSHLWRDMGTGGVALLWPLTRANVDLPYAAYFAAVLVSLLAALWPQLRARPGRAPSAPGFGLRR